MLIVLLVGTNLKETLDNEQCKTLVITGLTTDHCVSTTHEWQATMVTIHI